MADFSRFITESCLYAQEMMHSSYNASSFALPLRKPPEQRVVMDKGRVGREERGRGISGMKIVDGYRVMSESSSPSRIERGDKVEESVDKAQGTKDGGNRPVEAWLLKVA
ncbi:hypothetical protein G3M48_005861 [Beauveria asiatica]|uniref:Uncharacterized protein n=1 Tax=Beauveria asiatica TaxID=1069075 RepID=A0AAW0RRE3_9HYPO